MFNRHGAAMLLHANNTNGDMLSNSGGSSKTLTLHEINQDLHHTPTRERSISRMKREHKAARTLGIIMGKIFNRDHSKASKFHSPHVIFF